MTQRPWTVPGALTAALIASCASTPGQPPPAAQQSAPPPSAAPPQSSAAYQPMFSAAAHFYTKSLHLPGRQARGRRSFRSAALCLSAANAAKVVAEACRKPSDVGVPVTHWSSGLLTVRGSFSCADDLIAALYRYMVWHNQSSPPFRWS